MSGQQMFCGSRPNFRHILHFLSGMHINVSMLYSNFVYFEFWKKKRVCFHPLLDIDSWFRIRNFAIRLCIRKLHDLTQTDVGPTFFAAKANQADDIWPFNVRFALSVMPDRYLASSWWPEQLLVGRRTKPLPTQIYIKQSIVWNVKPSSNAMKYLS